MKIVSRYWTSIITTIFIALLIMLAVRQLNWIDEMGVRERARLTRDLSATGGQLAQAIRDEFMVLPAVFRMDGDDVEKAFVTSDWKDFSHRWDTWKVYATDPSMVAGFHILDINPQNRHGVLSSWNGTKFVHETSRELARELQEKVLARESTFGIGAPIPVVSDDIIVPIDPLRFLWFIIRIDQKAVTRKLIPRLAYQYLQGNSDYFFRIVDLNTDEILYASYGIEKEDVFAHPDIRYSLVGARNLLPPPQGKDVMDRQAIPPGFGETPPKDIPGESPQWVLEAVHRSGSLATVVRAETLRNAVLSMSIIGLLAAAFTIFALAIRRQRDVATRQAEFIASITHELKTPIAVIRAAADNLADGVVRDPDRTAVYGGTIKRESGRLANMIDRLLAYARLGDGSKYRYEPLDLRPLVTRVVNGYRAELEEARFEVDVSLPETPVIVRGDIIALEFALGNLISNALKHARGGLYLGMDVRVEHTERKKALKKDWAVLSVSDRGPGVARQEKKLIFETFYRGKNAQNGQIPGSGIGLGLIRRVVEVHAGIVRLEGNDDGGSTFVVRLPLEVRDGG